MVVGLEGSMNVLYLICYLKLFFHLSLSFAQYKNILLDRAVREYQKNSKNPKIVSFVLFAHTRENTTNVCLENRTILASFCLL